MKIKPKNPKTKNFVILTNKHYCYAKDNAKYDVII